MSLMCSSIFLNLILHPFWYPFKAWACVAWTLGESIKQGLLLRSISIILSSKFLGFLCTKLFLTQMNLWRKHVCSHYVKTQYKADGNNTGCLLKIFRIIFIIIHYNCLQIFFRYWSDTYMYFKAFHECHRVSSVLSETKSKIQSIMALTD